MTPAYRAQSDTTSILAVTGVFGTAALTCVILRLYVRSAMLKFVGADDYVMLVAMVRLTDGRRCYTLTDSSKS